MGVKTHQISLVLVRVHEQESFTQAIHLEFTRLQLDFHPELFLF